MRTLPLVALLLLFSLDLSAQEMERGKIINLVGKITCAQEGHARAFLEERTDQIKKIGHNFTISSTGPLDGLPTGCKLRSRDGVVVLQLEERYVQRKQGTFIRLSLLLVWPHEHIQEGDPRHIFVVVENDMLDRES